MTRARTVPPITVLVALVATVVLVGCGDDAEDDAASSTTASSTTESTTTAPPTSDPTTTESGLSAGDGTIVVTIGTAQLALTLQSCTSGSESALELTAQDSSGNTLTVSAQDGTGSVTYRGPSQEREGAVRSVTVQADGTFDVSGIVSIADDSAPGPDDLTITGLCAP
jgi:hypothetical protein